MKRRLLCLLLTLVMVLSLIPGTALADSAKELSFRLMMSNDGQNWTEGDVFDSANFEIGRWYQLKPYGDDAALSGGTLEASNGDIVEIMDWTDQNGNLLFYNIHILRDGTVTLTYTCADNTKYETTLTLALADGFYKEQTKSSSGFLDMIFLENCNCVAYYVREAGFSEDEKVKVSVSFSDEQTHAEWEFVKRADSDVYDIKITFLPDTFIRNGNVGIFIDLDGARIASKACRTRTMGKIAYGLFSAREMTESNLLQDQFCVGDVEYVWLLTEHGLTLEDANAAVVTAKQDGQTDFPLTVTPVLKDGSTDRYDLKIDVDIDNGVPQGWVEYRVNVVYNESNLNLNLQGRFDRPQQAGEIGKYVIYTSDRPDSGAAVSMDSDGTYLSTVYGQGNDMTAQWTARAYIWSSADNAYAAVEDGSVVLQPQRIWIEASPYFGNPDFLSLVSGETRVSELTGENLPSVNKEGAFRFNGYGLEGYQNTGTVCAEIEVVENGTSLGTVTIKTPYRGRVTLPNTFAIPDTATTADVNSTLQTIADNAKPGNEYTVTLAAKTYEGTIVIPRKFYQQAQKLYLVGQEGTVVEHIDLNRSYLYGLTNVDFKAPENDTTPAIYNGYCLDLNKCGFRGYSVACESTNAGYITPFNCLFVDNDIALRVDIAGATGNLFTTGGDHNLFVDNGTAVQVLSLNDNLKPYDYRVSECNFIENGTDFDIQAPGRFYFYRNFYGKWANKHQHGYDELPYAVYAANNEKIVQYRAPKVTGQDSDTKIVTNFRWKHPVEQVLTQNAHIGSFMANSAAVSLMSEDGIATSGDTNVNELTADWENSTVILNEQANNLTVSGDVFRTAANGAAIPVLDQQEQTLGTWNIPAAASAVALFSEAPETPFNAGLTVEKADGAISVTVVDSTALASLAPTLTVPAANAYTAEVLFDKEAVEDVICANGSVTFPVTAGGTYTIAAKSVPGSLLIGNDFTLGFGSYHDEGQENPQLLVMQTRDDDNNSGWFDLDGEYEGYVPLHAIRVRAGRPSDSLGYYDEAEDVTIQVQKIRIEHLEGEENTFSFSPDSLVTEVTGQNDVQLYAMDGQAGRIRLWADVKLVVNGEELDETFTISGRMKFQPIMEENARYFESLEALEAYLHEPPQAFVNGTIYRLYLKSGKHKGTLTLPEKFGGPHIYLSGMPNGSTTVEGGIDLNNGSLISVSEISFVAPSGTDTKAIYNGGVGVISNCSFYNYDVALDSSSAGQVGALQGDLFVNNTVAVRADTAKATKISEAWMGKNTFINNETAIQVLSLHRAIGPFAYRVTNSNFINNGTDFDLDHAGSYFFYKNYFGKYIGDVKPGKSGLPAETDRSTLNLDKLLQARSLNSLNRVLESRSAIIAKADGVTATTNPRWAFPVIKWWYKDVLDEAAVFGGNTLVSEPSLFSEEAVEEEYVNYLTSDWDGTEILNEEAGNLQLDARAFGGNAEKAIDVVTVDRNTGEKTVIGTWSFDAAQPALLSEQTAGGTFHAGVTVKIGTGSATVTVEDSDVLRDLQPTFTVPAMRDRVQVVGPDNSVQEVHAVNNTLTARASCGGTYTILPYADLGKVAHEDGSISVVVAEEFAGKQVLVASYDAFGKFLGLVPTIVKAGEAIQAAPMEGADLLTVFLVESMQDMTPKTAAITHDVT